MTVQTSSKICPRCNSAISEDAPGGLCPRCLMQFVAMSTGSANFSSEDRSPPDLETVRTAFPHLEILEFIGQGGMGAVYKARQTKLDRIVALKILPQRLAGEPQFAERFEREGRLLARLSHPNIIGVHDFGQAGGHYYLLMEYVDGVNLRQALASGQFTPQQSLSIIPKICEALQYAHDEGVLHRDIKPENVLMDTKGRVKIADFGIAKLSGADDKTGLTATGAAIGTPHYMAPEQIERPSDVDHRADIFSLGVVFYEMLTGELPLGRFAAPSERRELLDTRIDQVVMRALEKDRERRQQSANQVRTEVESLSQASETGKFGSMASAPQPPMLAASKPWIRHELRPNIALALVAASILVPLAITMFPGVRRDIVSYLAMLVAWLGLPGTILGLQHLRHLGKSGQRQGLLSAVAATTFWPFAIALVVFFVLATHLLQALHGGNMNAVEPLEVTAVLVAGLVAIYLSVRYVLQSFKRVVPQDGGSHAAIINSTTRVAVQASAGTLWILFGLAIVWLTPVGTLERLLLGLILIGVAVVTGWSIKRWIERTVPTDGWLEAPKHPVDQALVSLLKVFAVLIWCGLLVFTLFMMFQVKPRETLTTNAELPPQNAVIETDYLMLDIVAVSTNDNVLTIDMVDNNSTPYISDATLPVATTDDFTIDGVRRDASERELSQGEVPDNFKTEFRFDFQGPKLQPEAVTNAVESYSGSCLYPGEPSEPLNVDFEAGKTATLAFAFPDAKTAQACKLRLERQIYAEQWPAAIELDGTRRLLLQTNSAFGEYSVFVESRR